MNRSLFFGTLVLAKPMPVQTCCRGASNEVRGSAPIRTQRGQMPSIATRFDNSLGYSTCQLMAHSVHFERPKMHWAFLDVGRWSSSGPRECPDGQNFLIVAVRNFFRKKRLILNLLTSEFSENLDRLSFSRGMPQWPSGASTGPLSRFDHMVVTLSLLISLTSSSHDN